MILHVCRRQHHVRQTRDIGQAADILQLVVTLEDFRHRNHVDSFIFIVQLQHRVKDNAVRLTIKITAGQNLAGLGDGLLINEHRAQHGLLGFYILWGYSFFNHDLTTSFFSNSHSNVFSLRTPA